MKERNNANPVTHHRCKNLIIGSLLLLIVISITLGVRMSWRTMIGQVENVQMQALQDCSTNLYSDIERRFAILDGYSAFFTRESLESDAAVLENLQHCDEHTQFAHVCFVYPDGRLVRDDGASTFVNHRTYFQRAMQGEHAIEFLLSSAVDATSKIGLAVPVILDDKVEGVLMGLYAKDDFRTLIEKTYSDVRGFSYICDSNGKLVMGTGAAETFLQQQGLRVNGGNFFTLLERSEVLKGSREEAQEWLRTGQSGQISYRYNDTNRYATFVPLGVSDWYVMSILHEDQLREVAVSMAGGYYYVISYLLILLLAVIAFLMVKERNNAKREQKKSEEIKYRLEHDELTGVLTEKAFVEAAEKRLYGVQPGEYCVIYLDIYKFNLINEMYGYEKGDELLRAMGAELQRFSEEYQGLCGRISGDHFVLFVKHHEKVIREFNTKRYQANRVVPAALYLHYGIFVIQNTDVPVSRMIDAAKLAQGVVKGNYDDRISYYDEKIKAKELKEQEIISTMQRALKSGEFVVYLQPQYNYRSGAVIGAEALVRWVNPQKGLISPGDFIPVFERNGFITWLDEYVWEQACKLQRRWLNEGKQVLPISVNVSRADLLKGGIADRLMYLIQKYRLTPDMLRVEITESAYIDNPQKMIMEIQRVAQCGILVEMDDFGSGYSSLNMLKDMPVQVLKTDLRFLSATGIESRKHRILGSVIRMAHEMGIRVVAEGVETKEQADHLLELGCEDMQGFYFARPIPVEQYEELVYASVS